MTDRSPFEQIRWRLEHSNPVTWEHEVITAEVAALSDLDRGRLIGPLWRKYLGTEPKPHQLNWIVFGIEQKLDVGGVRPPLFDGPSADAALEALAYQAMQPVPRQIAEHHNDDIPWSVETSWHMRIGHCIANVCLRLVEEPGDVGRAALAKLLPVVEMRSKLAAMIGARFAGDVEREMGLMRQLREAVETPLAQAELDARFTAPVTRWATLGRMADNATMTTLGTDWRDSPADDLPAYREWASTAVDFALERVRAVQSGAEPYKADKLMSKSDASAIGRAFRAVFADELAFGMEALAEIWRGTAFAPDAKAKTLPSQTLTYEIGHAVIAEPRPAAVLLMAEIARDVRHATVKKRMARFSKQALTALGQMPERVLEMAASAPLPAELSKLLKPALEGLLLRDWDMDATVWQQQMTEKSLWPLTKRLIWQVTGEATFTALPVQKKDELVWQTLRGDVLPFDNDARIRLWHPIEGSEDDRDGWRGVVSSAGTPQPLTQAYRELYPLPEAERSGVTTTIFEGHRVAQIAMVGLARRSGFSFGFEDDINLKIGGQLFSFSAGVRVYPGAGGEGETGPIRLVGPAKTLGEVPPRVLNEALRRFDLIIAAGTTGVEDSAPIKHPQTFQEIFPGGQSIAMRKAWLGFARPNAKIEGRWLELATGARIHLGTGRIIRDGDPVELTGKVKAKATSRADDKVMDRIWAAIAELGLAPGP